MSIQFFNNEILKCDIKTIYAKNEIWFKAKDIATILDYVNTKQAIIDNVDIDDKTIFKNLYGYLTETPPKSRCEPSYSELQAIYINESGLYSLILKSKLDKAKEFKKWITKEVLPSIRKTGSYGFKKPIENQLLIMSEKDLHIQTVKFIKKYYPDTLISVSLGELQDTIEKRITSSMKGYIAGEPDLHIIEANKDFNGMYIEFKNPNLKGILSEKQIKYHENLRNRRFKVVVIDSYEKALYEIINYLNTKRIFCCLCPRKFKNNFTLSNHKKYFHKIV